MSDYLKTEFNAFGQAVGAPVEPSIPVAYPFEKLSGQYVELLPIKANHSDDFYLDQLWQTVNTEPNAGCWTYLPYSGFETREMLKQQLQNNFGFHPSFHYLIVVNHEAVGWIALLNPRLAHAAIEIGNVYFSHRLRRSTAASEAVFLLLKACFAQNFRRIEWKCDDFNEPSKRAALRFGFSFEGLFRKDRIVKGRNRNTTWFSIIDEDWNPLKAGYEAWLSPENIDQNGQQQQHLNDLIMQFRPL
ncbi:GNAT family N-acetyltransferase [Acinetobacter ihumii]|uniref:GNAT family N-acetyltransferase n=1 Tax=Acinetobacter ihumii TaxID=2483802 RepID=UPI00102F46CE|nr:GNAT family protein [Acinetobacter ihumii]